MKRAAKLDARLDWDALRRRLAANDVAARTLDEAEVKRVLQQRAAALARRSETQATRAELEVLKLQLGDEWWAIESRFVREVQRPSALTRVPGAPAHLLGILALRGEIVPAFDLHALLGVTGRARGESARFVVLGEAQAELCIAADAVVEFVRLREEELLEPSAELRARGPFVRAVTERALVVIDVRALLADRRLFVGESAGPQHHKGA